MITFAQAVFDVLLALVGGICIGRTWQAWVDEWDLEFVDVPADPDGFATPHLTLIYANGDAPAAAVDRADVWIFDWARDDPGLQKGAWG